MRDLDSRRRLVDHLSADAARAGRLRGDVRARSRHLAARRRRHRDPHRDRRLAGRRRRAAPGVGDQPRHRGAQPRAHQLRRGRAGAGRRRPGASGVQQPVRRDHRRAGARRADCAPGGRAPAPSACISSTCSAAAAGWAAPPSTRPIGRASSAAAARVDRPAGAVPAPAPLSNTTGAVLDPIVSLRQIGAHSAGRHRAPRVHDRICRQRGGGAAADREVPRPPRGRARAGAGQHAQPDRAAASRADHRGDHALPAAGGPAAVRRSAPARRPRPIRANTRGQAELWKYGISGDLPILLLRLNDDAERAAVPRAAEGARVPAAAGLRVRSRRAERARVELPPGSAAHADADRREQSRAAAGSIGPAACSCAAPI